MICLFARENRQICASGSGVERRLAKAKVAGSNPVSRSYEQVLKPSNHAGFGIFLCAKSLCLLCASEQMQSRFVGL